MTTVSVLFFIVWSYSAVMIPKMQKSKGLDQVAPLGIV